MNIDEIEACVKPGSAQESLMFTTKTDTVTEFRSFGSTSNSFVSSHSWPGSCLLRSLLRLFLDYRAENEIAIIAMTLGVSFITLCKEYNILKRKKIICNWGKDGSKSLPNKMKLCYSKKVPSDSSVQPEVDYTTHLQTWLRIRKYKLGRKKGLKFSGDVTSWHQRPVRDNR